MSLLVDHEETQPVIPMKFMVDRHVYYQDEFHHNFYCEKPETSFIDNTLSSIKSKNLKSCLSSIVPVSYWMRKYKWRDYVLSDIISGITVAIMHIPQGMAYALLGNVPPIVGIYMAFFPVLIYFIFGTSKHVSMGTFAIVCLMTGKVVASYSTSVNSSITNNTLVDFSEIINNHTIPTVYSPMQVATAVTFSVGIIQLVMFILRLGIISSLLSKSLVSGFTTGAAIYVLIYQIKDLLGLKLPKRKISHFKLVYTIIDIFNALNYSNYASLIISAVTISIMMINNELFKPWLEQKCSMLFPIELIAIVSGTIISKYFDLPGQYMIDTVGNIPTGLPKPELPTIELIGNVMVDCIAITMVSYTVTLSMALIFAQKLHYDIDSNQELFAMVSLKGMLLQAKQFLEFWRLSRLDGMVWMVTVVTVIIIGIDFGLLIGLITSIGTILLLSMKSYACLLGQIPNTELYLDISKYRGITELPGIKIFHYRGGLNFANRNYFKSKIFKHVNINPQKEFESRKKEARKKSPYQNDLNLENNENLRCIVIDFSALTYIDPSGIAILHAVYDEFSSIGILVCLAGCSGPIFESISKYDQYVSAKTKLIIFMTINDAITYACNKFISNV
ncbi:sulfate transporter-like isoform X4 [Microplitis mediator]|uniref:sulfate transporter-like isoform X4 n=1 Tax=Microplitis mediator TaxID=375433 RepID=UPI0025548C3A|nr:sulfate transporter-like isoform X4 [Microplitis mediator]